MTRRATSGEFPRADPARILGISSGGVAMNHRRLAAVLVVLAIGVALGQTAGSADPKDEKNETDSLALQWAKAQLKLAEMNLQRVQELNKKIPGTLIGSMVREFSEVVEQARTELKIVERAPDGDPFRACVERVKLELRAAENRAQRALETHEKAPDVVTKSDVERMRLIAIVTDLQLQRGLKLQDASPQEQLQWQLEVIGYELGRVKQYTYLLGQNRFGQFSPGGL
jgi:hypothetical protein